MNKDILFYTLSIVFSLYFYIIIITKIINKLKNGKNNNFFSSEKIKKRTRLFNFLFGLKHNFSIYLIWLGISSTIIIFLRIFILSNHKFNNLNNFLISVIQSQSTILAIIIALGIVVLQLSSYYSEKFFKLKELLPEGILIVVIFIIDILLNLTFLTSIGENSNLFWLFYINIVSFVLLIPFTYNTIYKKPINKFLNKLKEKSKVIDLNKNEFYLIHEIIRSKKIKENNSKNSLLISEIDEIYTNIFKNSNKNQWFEILSVLKDEFFYCLNNNFFEYAERISGLIEKLVNNCISSVSENEECSLNMQNILKEFLTQINTLLFEKKDLLNKNKIIEKRICSIYLKSVEHLSNENLLYYFIYLKSILYNILFTKKDTCLVDYNDELINSYLKCLLEIKFKLLIKNDELITQFGDIKNIIINEDKITLSEFKTEIPNEYIDHYDYLGWHGILSQINKNKILEISIDILKIHINCGKKCSEYEKEFLRNYFCNLLIILNSKNSDYSRNKEYFNLINEFIYTTKCNFYGNSKNFGLL